ncbi:CIC11C00000000994 [Sungouiella intermedia]|uniref:RNA helicase n=1 Tax=Sungouiella intermedia TaxID=45354 RepID=A0A1L0BNZ9_9ASCO|nr:CIC11C00000000994 [[Candida] intermedia]
METDLSKAEKLRRRQEQLAKWKLKKTPTSQETTPVAEDPVSAEEKKRLERQKKLEEWKRKKQQQNINQEKGKDTTLEEKRRKLQEWKHKRQETAGASKAVVRNLLSGISKSKPKKPVNGVKRMVFDDEDESSVSKPVFKKPAMAKSEYKQVQEEEEDALDKFLEGLDESDKVDKVEQTIELDEEEDVEIDDDDELLNRKIKNLQQGKELVQVDHDKIDYLPFKKCFYTEPQSVKDLSDEEVIALRLEMDGIKVTGKDCPRPVWSFTQLGLSALIMSIMEEKLAYTKPTSIQSQALPAIMSGRDFLGIAKTGSGKTLAFVLPLLKHVQDQPPLEKGDGPIAILLTPTRELALQIYKQLTYFTKKLGISACCCYGGSSIEPQIAELKKGSQVLVSTPGRLIDLLAANGGRVCNLKRVTYVVLDEADRMFDFGFEPQVKKIFSQIRPDKQSILFSATFAKKLEMLAKLTLRDPVEIVVGGISVVAPEITQKVEFFEETEDQELEALKFQKLVEILKANGGIKKLVFVEKQDSADRLLVKLLEQDVPSLVIHGGKDQIDRKYAIKEFSAKNSGVDVLIATSIAARGLDVKGLDLVVNYDPPNHMEDYVHRVGRTGRAGNSGTAYTFVSSQQERPITDLVKALRLSKVPEDEIDARLVKISETFLGKVKDGKEKFRFGFGGNGLNKLDELRNTNQLVDRKAHDIDGTREVKAFTPKADSREASQGPQIDLPEFTVIEGRAEETAGPDRCKFHSRITINDLPQKARWTVVNADSLAEIIEATSTSITNKGQFYPPNTKVPTTIKVGGKEVTAPPRLYLLIEGLTESSVNEANRMIRQKMLEGLELAEKDDNSAPSGKYTV